MIRLKPPSLVGKERKIFLECANGFTHKKKYATIAASYVDEVEKCSNGYVTYVPHNISGLPHITLTPEDKAIVNKVYEQKFAPEDSIGRKYYNIIMGNAVYCPICGDGKLKNLDHFLPKCNYPLLCVTPINLIPTCRDCNMDKSSSNSDDYYEIPFHPYLEDMNEEWVECVLEFYPDKTCKPEYINGFDKTKDPDMWRKYDAHMNITDIANTFAGRASAEIANTKGYYANELAENGIESIRKAFKGIAKSAEQVDVNSWKAPLYRELL